MLRGQKLQDLLCISGETSLTGSISWDSCDLLAVAQHTKLLLVHLSDLEVRDYAVQSICYDAEDIADTLCITTQAEGARVPFIFSQRKIADFDSPIMGR
jgi:hypothetical protein